MSNLAKEIGWPGFLIGALAVGGTFTGIDYLSSKEPNKKTFNLTAQVEQIHNNVYVPFGERGRFTTKKNTIAGKLGSFAKDTIGIGNSLTGYIVIPDKLSYMTKGGIIFDPKLVEKTMEDKSQLAVISESRLENLISGDYVQFHPKSDLTLGELVIKGRAKSFSVNNDNGNKKYDQVLYNPINFSKVE